MRLSHFFAAFPRIQQALLATALGLGAGAAQANDSFEALFPPPQLPAPRDAPSPEELLDQDFVFVSEEHAKLIDQRRNLGVLGPDLMGDQTNLQTGSTEFIHTDISLPGNSGLPVELIRRFSVAPKRGEPGLRPAAFADWELDVPYLSGTFSTRTGWQVVAVGGSTTARCSVTQPQFAVPPQQAQTEGGAYPFQAHEYWQGYHMHLPGGGGGELLWVSPTSSQPKPSSGGPFHWATNGRWFFSCENAASQGGESFVGHSPDGLRYYFTHEVTRPVPKLGGNGSTGKLARMEVRFYATRIEDGFNNSVDFNWSGNRLNSISANDGRTITLHYNPNGHVESASDGTHSWTYTYSGTGTTAARHSLASVALPDSSSWEINFAALSNAVLQYERGLESTSNCYGAGEPISGDYSGSLSHPSGASATFTVGPITHGRTQVTRICVNESPPGTPVSDDYSWHTLSYDVLSLKQKSLTGAGLAPQQWTFSYLPSYCFAGVECQLAPDYSVTTVRAPDGSALRYRFGTRFRGDEGKLLQVEHAGGVSGNTLQNVLRTETSSYRLTDSGQAYPTPIGASPQYRGGAFPAERYLPLESKTTVQDGVSFSWTASTFDAYAFPLSATESSTLGFTRTRVTAYARHPDRWVLGQVASVHRDGVETDRLTYDPVTAKRTGYFAFGQKQQTLTYHADGTMETVADANDEVTRLSEWHRGLPQRVEHPDTTVSTAVVNALGWITQRIDESNVSTGFSTGYGYDALGRLTGVTYLGNDSVAWSPTTIAYARVTATEFDLTGPHWRRTETTGSRVHHTYFDARWQPVLQRQSSGDGSVGERFVRRSFDHAGRTVFESYPVSTVSSYTDVTQGVRTLYDAIGRVTATQTDSELGLLSTATTYIAPLQTQHTDARQQLTTTTYQAFDTPDYGAPLTISSPEGLTTTYTRDSDGKPLSLTREGSYTAPGSSPEPLSMTRRYVYDSHQRLCKTIEADAGTTVFAYDPKGQLQWRATGQNTLSSTTQCQRDSVPLAARSVHAHDTRGRLRFIDHPAGTDDVGYTYADDGALATATVGVLNPQASDWQTVRNRWTYTYNRRRLLESETLLVSPENKSFAVNWSHNARGDLAGLVYPSGLSLDFNPNAYGEPRQAGSFATAAVYHPSGRLTGFSYGSGATRTVGLNTRQLPQRIHDQQLGMPVLDHTLTYDPAGNVKSIADGVPGGLESRTLHYDGRNRLTSITASPQGNETYVYDPLDNIRQTIQAGTDRRFHYAPATQRLEWIRTPAGQNLFGYLWTSRGELTRRSQFTPGIVPVTPPTIFRSGFESPLIETHTDFAFDQAGRLTGTHGGQIAHLYDAHGHRVRSAQSMFGNRYEVYSRGGQLLHVEDTSNNTRLDYVQLGGQLVAERTQPSSGGSATVSYLHSDLLGSLSVKTASQGSVIYRARYQAFGAPLDGWRDGPGYTKHVMDSASELVYMQQRYYDPATLRFISTDPVSADPTNFNRFWYANNNPYTFLDPDGRDCRSANGRTTCSVPITGSKIPKKISFPTPDGITGKENHTRSSPAYHAYGYGTRHEKSDAAVQDAIISDPTPGSDQPATQQGTLNEATPTGGRGLLARVGIAFGNNSNSPVKSYAFQDANSNLWTVNVTEPGHGLHFGYVLRGSVDGVALSIGEGWAIPQVIPGLDEVINSVWVGHNQRNIDNAR